MRNLQSEGNVITKPTDKGSAVLVWNRNDFLKEADS